FLTHSNYRNHLQTTQASAVILSPEFLSSEFIENVDQKKNNSISFLITDNPRLAIAKAAQFFQNNKIKEPGCHPSVIIGKNTVIPKSVSIAAGVIIGENGQIGEHVTIGAGCIIGDNCHI